MTEQLTKELHRDLAGQAEECVELIAGPTVGRMVVVDQLLDIRNLGRGRDIGLELTVDEMLESIPGGRQVSSEWWLSCLTDLADHAAFLAAGYPPVPELSAA